MTERENLEERMRKIEREREGNDLCNTQVILQVETTK